MYFKGRVPPHVHQNNIITRSQIQTYSRVGQQRPETSSNHHRIPNYMRDSPVLPALKEIKMHCVLLLLLIFSRLASRLSFDIEPSSIKYV